MKKTFLMILFAFLIGAIMLISLSGLIDEILGMCISMTLATIFTIIVAITAFKHHIKLVVVIMTLLMFIEIGILCYNLYSFFTMDYSENFYLVVEEDNSGKTKMFTYGDNEFYTFKLSGVSVSTKGQNYSLEDALKNDILHIEDIFSKTIANENTSGYKVYYDGGVESIKNDEYSIVVCDNDIIFGPYSYTYNEEICKPNVLD